MTHTNDQRWTWNSVGAVALLLLGSWAIGCGRPSLDSPEATTEQGSGFGIVLITVDGLVPQSLEPFGGPEPAPHLAALVTEGRGWDDAWTTTPMTRPAVATYLTALVPEQHGVWDDFRDALDAEVPTLATQLAAAGFETAAFPDAARLGFSSGLLNGFDVVDEPSSVALGINHWNRDLRDSAEQVEHFSTWLASLNPDSRWFAWLHLSTPLLAQMTPPAREEGSEMEPRLPFDDWLGQVRSALDQHRGDDSIAIAVAGTFANTRGEKGGLSGVGMSVGESAVAVPVVLRLPTGAGAIPASDVPVWAPDIPVTLAALAGVTFPTSEGRNLLMEGGTERVIYSWSMAPRDQMGWKPITAARRGAERFRGEGTTDDAILLARPVPVRLGATAALVETLRSRGLRPRPVAAEGREFTPDARRSAVTTLLLTARERLQRTHLRGVQRALERLVSVDPNNLAGLLGMGQLQIIGNDRAAAEKSLRLAVELYPGHPEAVHWYLHATWDPDDPTTEELIRLILPTRSTDPDLLYDLSCLRSLAGDLPEAEAFLRSSIEAGFRQWGHMEVDPDLRALRESGRFAAVMRELRQ